MRSATALLLAASLAACGGQGATGGSAGERPFAALEADLPRPGDPLPAFGGETLDGTPVSLETIAGKRALINHWFYG